ncbi:phosphate/phosphite/phosphonate ABC transporter substrate-binding protein [Roseovarius aestuariivivens]|uniref:phosphate/phosphite/phosphonate ABC transporter substrate-binding protein n=1 Tax=Roseovarius aestuariivivens TaxID=1888910 RepID=UPI0010813D6E|nr:PhnD/SsuA/transferrin family substrate-binding protein [Roseovarius aestuariivivens]
MRASLPMYDRPDLRGAHHRLWRGVRAALGHGPDTLSHPANPWDDWTAPDLLLSQTCGYPYRARLHGHVTLVATPEHRLPGCPPGHYASVFVARQSDPRSDPVEFAESPFAYNEPLSQSGWAAPATYAADRGFAFIDTRRTGAHVASARAVADGHADLAALDAQTWRLMQRHDPAARHLRVIAMTDPTPALPYITGPDRVPAPLRAALAQAIRTLPAPDRDALGLYGLVTIPAAVYLAVPTPAPPPA